MDRPLRTTGRWWWVLLAAGAVAGGLSLIPAAWWQARLTFGSGESISHAAPLLPKLWLAIATVSLTLAFVVRIWGGRIEHSILRRLRGWNETDSKNWSAGRWFIVAAALVLWFDWPALIDGYFESDDFVFLTNDRTGTFPDLLYVVMNDHVFPLGRVWIRLCHEMFGVNAWCYNALAIASLMVLLWSGCLLLREIGASVFAVMVYLALNVGWTLWGEFTSGEYILLAYQSLMTAAILAAWSVLRWYRTGKLTYMAAMLFALLYAGLINLSGLWVSCAAIVFASCEVIGRYGTDDWKPAWKRTWPLIVGITACIALLVGFYWHAFHRPGGPQFLSVAGERGGISGFAIQTLYIETTACMSLVLPVPHHLSDLRMMWPAILLTLAIGVTLVMVSMRRLPNLQRVRLAACIVVSLGVVAMVALGRPSNEIGNVVPPKYLFLPYHWICLACGLIATEVANRSVAKRDFSLKAICFFVLACWLCHGTASRLGARGVPFMETTRGGELYEHRRERAALDEIRQVLNESLQLDQPQEIVLPDISGASLCKQYPALRFPWGQEPPLSLFVDVLAAAPEKTTFVQVATLDEARLSPKFINAIKQHKRLAELYRDLDNQTPQP